MGKKLSKVQEEVLALMNDNWELGRDTGGFSSPTWWLQKGGLGHGGEARYIRKYDTGLILCNEGLIERTNPNKTEYPTERYRLSIKGLFYLQTMRRY